MPTGAGDHRSVYDLSRHVWTKTADILPNTIEVYIGYWRNKIDRPFSQKTGLAANLTRFWL